MMILPILPKSEWRTPSLSQSKDMFGNENRTVFRIDARANDGGVVWRGWFEDRDDADAFLYAAIMGSLKNERELWNLCTPNWQPYLDELITYEFVSMSFLTGTGTNLTYTFPSDWNNGDNSIETIGAGGSGGASRASGATASGGAGGGYSKITNYTKPGATTSYTIGTGGAGKNTSSGVGQLGSAGGDVYFGNTSLATSSVGSKGGGGGAVGGASAAASGGSAASGVGTTKYSGGDSGSCAATAFTSATGGGGAAGPYGAGGASASVTTNGTTAGGTGGNGFGGAGSTYAANPGGDGTEFDATHGSGGGGRGSNNTGLHGSGGGNYGGAGGAAAVASGTIYSDDGASGLIVITYSPLIGGLFGGGRSALGLG